MGPRRSSATPVLAEAGTAVADRAGRAVRAVACAEARGRGMVGTPACAARPRRAASVGGRVPGPVRSSMVRMGRPFGLGTTGGADPPPGAAPLRPEGVVVARERRPTIQRTGEPEFEPMRRVAGPLMAEVAKNGGRRPGTTDRMSGCGNLDGDYKGDGS